MTKSACASSHSTAGTSSSTPPAVAPQAQLQLPLRTIGKAPSARAARTDCANRRLSSNVRAISGTSASGISPQPSTRCADEPRRKPLPPDGSDDWQQDVDDLPTPVELDAGA